MKSFFNFSKGQKIGVAALAVIITIQIIFLNKGSGISIPDPFVISAEQYKIIDSSDLKYVKYKKNKFKKEYNLSQFDPNDYKVSDWQKIGFSEKQANIIVNYKNKIDGFKVNSDVKKVFVISDKKYNELEQFIEIDRTKVNEVKYPESDFKIEKPLVVYELNSASINELISINGIGEFTASGIIKHRNLIGGFHSILQLKEVYGIEDGNYNKIVNQLEIDKSNIKKINVNELSIFELKKHHYISWSMAEAIINKRLISKLTDLEFLVTDGMINNSKLDILVPYIVFN